MQSSTAASIARPLSAPADLYRSAISGHAPTLHRGEPLWIANTGIRGAHDLVWVGPAANYAAKLTELDAAFPTWITHRVYDSMSKDVKTAKDGRSMWEARVWKTMSDLSIYRSNFHWSIS